MLSWLFRKPTEIELKNKAYQIYSEWGTKLRIPRDKRLFDKFPQVDRFTIKLWIDEFRKIGLEVDEFLSKRGSFNSEEFRKELSAKYPFMNKKSLDRATHLGAYDAWHDGYKRD